MSALAMAATLSIAASASTTIDCDDPDPIDCADASWGSIWADGKYASAETFSDGEVTVTVNFEWTDLAKDEEYCAFKPAFANGWEGIYKAHPEYVSGFVCAKEDATQNDDGKYETADGTILDWAPQKDGFFQVYNTDVTSVTFTLSADCVADMKDYSTYYGNGKATANDDGTTTDWDGFLIQKGNNGIAITSVEFSQDGVKLNTELEAEGDDGAAEDGTTDDGTTDDGSADDGTADDGTTDDGSADDGTTDDGTTDDGTTDDGSAGGTTGGTTGGSTGGSTGSTGGSTGTGTATGNTTTGSTAGLALAGLALAGAAVVVSKKR